MKGLLGLGQEKGRLFYDPSKSSFHSEIFQFHSFFQFTKTINISKFWPMPKKFWLKKFWNIVISVTNELKNWYFSVMNELKNWKIKKLIFFCQKILQKHQIFEKFECFLKASFLTPEKGGGGKSPTTDWPVRGLSTSKTARLFPLALWQFCNKVC